MDSASNTAWALPFLRPVEHLHRDFAAWLDIIYVLGDDGEAVGLGERSEKLRALFAGQPCGVAVVVSLNDHTHELAPAVVLNTVEKAGVDRGLVQSGVPLHDEQRRADEFLEGDVGGDGIARQAHHRHAAAAIHRMKDGFPLSRE